MDRPNHRRAAPSLVDSCMSNLLVAFSLIHDPEALSMNPEASCMDNLIIGGQSHIALE